ncbi:hypothetical protein Bpla01_11640 [Burkholderia plantarii]|nr:hypothetical protein Bpla01_11640 [Burkholderia plantarii]
MGADRGRAGADGVGNAQHGEPAAGAARARRGASGKCHAAPPLLPRIDAIPPIRRAGGRAASGRRGRGDDQHSTMFTASPPREVSLYFVFMSAPVSRIVLITESSDT